MLWTALIFGLLGSFHCIGMCGPIAFMLPVSRDNELKKIFQIFLYHTGRLLAYGTIGLAFGLVGQTLDLFGLQQQLSILTGVIMIAIILFPAVKFLKFNISGPVTNTIGKLKSSMGGLLKKKSPDMFFTIGVLNGFLPCGLVYLAVFGAVATGGILDGSLYMVLFGLGTVPLMTSVVYSRGLVGPSLRNKVRKLIPAFVVILGLIFIIRGMGLGIPYLSPAPDTALITTQASCH
ncbi:MAG TPA: sulfite exporter TauE/SafE family protein [Gillisia sp.]|nr:sulfite exporter TauE/SafE family protein [Gillisia sp.]